MTFSPSLVKRYFSSIPNKKYQFDLKIFNLYRVTGIILLMFILGPLKLTPKVKYLKNLEEIMVLKSTNSHC